MPRFQFRHTITNALTELEGPTPIDVDGLLPEGTYAVRALSDEAPTTISIAASAGQSPVPGAVGHWTLGSDGQTLAGNPLTLVGPAPVLSPGFATLPVAKPRGFNTGVPDTGPITKCAVVRLTAGQGNAIIFGNSDAADGRFLVYSDGISTLRYRTDPGANTYDIDTAVPTGEWIFVALSLTDTTMTYYRGGTGAPPVTFSGSYLPGTRGRDIGIGNIAFTNGNPAAPMDIAEAFLFTETRSLAALETLHGNRIADLTARGVGLSPPFSEAQADPGASQPAAPTIRHVIAMSTDIGIYSEPADQTARGFVFEIDGVDQPETNLASMQYAHEGVGLYNIRVKAIGDNGQAGPYSAVTQVEIDGSEPAPMATTLQRTVTLEGVTYPLDRDVPVAQTVDGRPVIVTTDLPNIIAQDPPGGVQSNGGGGIGNGLMIDPSMIRDGEVQGFDTNIDTEGQKIRLTYDASLNKSIEVAGPLQIPDVPTSIVMGIRRSLVNRPWQSNQFAPLWSIGDYSVLTCIPHPLPANTYRLPPDAKGFDKLNYLYDSTSVSRDRCCARLTPPANFPIVYEDVLALTPFNIPMFRSNDGEINRVLGPDRNYSANWAALRSYTLNALHSDTISDTEWRVLADRIITRAIDLMSATDLGYTGTSGAGQGLGFVADLYFGAFLLNNAEMLERAQQFLSSELSRPFYISAAQEGIRAEFPTGDGKDNFLNSTYDAKQLDCAHGAPDGVAGNWNARYRAIIDLGIPRALIAIGLLRNGPGGVNGVQAVTGNLDPIGPANPRSAPFALMEEGQTRREQIFRSQGIDIAALYGEWHHHLPYPRWEQNPSQIIVPVNLPDIITPISGGFRVDATAYDNCTGTFAQMAVEYSDDKRSWERVTSASKVLEVTGLEAKNYWVRAAFIDTQGREAPMSPYWRESTNPTANDPHRGRVTPLGAASTAVPSSARLPALVHRPYTEWACEFFRPLVGGAVIDREVVDLYPSLGRWAGNPGQTHRWKLRRGVGANPPVDVAPFADFTVPDETADPILTPAHPVYRRTAADYSTAGQQDVYFEAVIEASDGVNPPVEEVSPRYYMPQPYVRTPGTLIDTEFPVSFQVDEFEIWNASFVFPTDEKEYELRIAGTPFNQNETPGFIYATKSGGAGRLRLRLDESGAAGERFRVTGRVIRHVGGKFATALELTMRNSGGSQSLVTWNRTNYTVGTDPRLVDIDFTTDPLIASMAGTNLEIDLNLTGVDNGSEEKGFGFTRLKVERLV